MENRTKELVMIKAFVRPVSKNFSKIEIGYFNLYENFDDREFFRTIIKQLFKDGDIIFFFFRREEDLTSREELAILRKTIFAKFRAFGNYQVLEEIDSKRFDSVASLTYNSATPNFLIDLWKYFYTCDFFIPNYDLTLDEYIDYLKIDGVDSIDGYGPLKDLDIDFFCIKGLGAD